LLASDGRGDKDVTAGATNARTVALDMPLSLYTFVLKTNARAANRHRSGAYRRARAARSDHRDDDHARDRVHADCLSGRADGSLFLEFAITALREASLIRLRPVLTTSAATVFGHFRLVFVSKPDAEARSSGIVLTGMIVGTLFTLFVAPVFYTLIAAEHRPDEPSEAVERTAPDGERAQPIAGIA
jgi:hypothetical protein